MKSQSHGKDPNARLQQILPRAAVAAAHDFAKDELGEIHSSKTCKAGISGMTIRKFIIQKQYLKHSTKLNVRAYHFQSQETKMTKDLKNTAELFGYVAAGLAVIGAMVIASLA